jgi:hypothetical protein
VRHLGDKGGVRGAQRLIRVGHRIGHGTDGEGRDDPSLWHLDQVPGRIELGPIGRFASPDDAGKRTAARAVILHHR